ncbi:MAG: hypothetical protein ACYSU0_11625 [Planctomycetota bacterium]|jgi:hypothetical protein
MSERNARRSALAASVAAAAAIVAGCGRLELPKPLVPPEFARVKERSPAFTVTEHNGGELSSKDCLGRALVVVAAEPGYAADVVGWLRLIERRAGEPGKRYVLLAVVEGDAADALKFAGVLEAECASLFAPEDRPPGNASRARIAYDLFGVPRMRAYRLSVEYRTRSEQIRRDEPRRADRMLDEAAKIDKRLSDRTKWKPGFRDAFGFVGEGPFVVVVGADGTLLALVDGPPDGGRAEKLAPVFDGLSGGK